MANTNRRLHQQREPTWRKFGNALGSLLSAAAVPGVVTACRTGMRITDIGFLGNFHAPAQAQSTQFFYSALPFQNMTSPSSSSSSSSVSAATFSTKHLAAAGFTGTWFEILWFFLVNGCVSALKEIGSTAHKAQNYRLLSDLLVIALTISTMIVAVVGVPLMYYSANMLSWIMEYDQSMLALVQPFSRITMIGWFPYVWNNILTIWLAIFSKVDGRMQVYLMMGCFGLNYFLNYLFIYGVDMIGISGIGYLGSAFATSLSRWVEFFGTYWLVRRAWHRHQSTAAASAAVVAAAAAAETAAIISFAADSFRLPLLATTSREQYFRWSVQKSHQTEQSREFVKHALIATVNGIFEDGQLTLIAVLAGRFGVVSAAAHQSMYNVFFSLASTVAVVASVTNVKISALLTEDDVDAARFAWLVSLAVILPTAATISVLLYILRDYVAFVFSTDEEVVSIIKRITLIVGCAFFSLGSFQILSSALIAQRRKIATLSSIIFGHWIACIPLAILFRSDHLLKEYDDLFGLWLAVTIGYSITMVFAALLLLKTNWKEYGNGGTTKERPSMDF